jgi:hypothetical protein
LEEPYEGETQGKSRDAMSSVGNHHRQSSTGRAGQQSSF